MKAFLLQWSVYDERNFVETRYTVFKNKESAMTRAHSAIREVFGEDGPEQMKTNFTIFDHPRDDEEHYCGGVSLKPIEYVED